MENLSTTIENAENVKNVNVAPAKKRSPRAKKENAPKEEKKEENVNALSKETLDAMLALNISESIKKNADRKSIFKKEFNNKADRTKCRTKFLNAISLFLLHTSHAKADLAIESLQKAREIANIYYVAGSTFTNYLDYCSENMDDNKKNLIKMFCKVNVELSAIPAE